MKRKRTVAALLLAAAMLASCAQVFPLPDTSHNGQPDAAASEAIHPLPADFIKGMDVSSVISLEQSGVVFRDADGMPQDLFLTLAEAGVDMIRVRVWNDPYDVAGNGYGGGNCDAAKAAEIGRRAAVNGMGLLVDFHYSDFWADPAQQLAPKAWAHMSLSQKETAVYDFTVASLEKILAAGAQVSMVQIGNEINGGMAGETDSDAVITLLKSASKAVRDVASRSGTDIRVAVHFTDPQKRDEMLWHAAALADAGLDYDLFGVSYYPYWHGNTDDLTALLTQINQQFGKPTVVLETAYPYTAEDGDGFPNAVSEGGGGFPLSVEGQAACLRHVMRAASDGGAVGVFCWEGAWIPVGRDAETNCALWEQYGSGWASSAAAGYDSSAACGGSAWDNQAFFDPNGMPLGSLEIFS